MRRRAGRVGAWRQYNGAWEGGYVPVAVAWAMPIGIGTWPLWTMWNAEIFLPEVWFGAEYAELRQKVASERTNSFETKPNWVKMIRRAKAAKLPFERCCDSLYGRSSKFRKNCVKKTCGIWLRSRTICGFTGAALLLGFQNPNPAKRG